MAASQRRKRRRRQARNARQESFFEALPLSLPAFAPVETRSAMLPQSNRLWNTTRDYTDAAKDLTIAALFDIGNAIWMLLRVLVSYRARTLYVVLAVVGLLTTVAILTYEADKLIRQYAPRMASPAVLVAGKASGIKLTDRNGVTLYDTIGQGGGGVVDLATLPKTFTNATLAAEDPNFYNHNGYSARSMIRAAYVDITSGSTAEGGSTLTQQLVKNALLTSEKTFERKFKELVLANKLEQTYSKDQILSMYVSEVPYGQGSYGVEQAAQTYFHTSARQLTLAQSALLAGLPQATSLLDPTIHPEAAKTRRDYVLDRMAALGMITLSQAKMAESEPVTVSSRQMQILAPHFVFYTLDQLRSQYGAAFLNAGNVVTTTLDINKQNLAQTTVTAQVDALRSHHVTNGGLVSLDPNNGDILAMVGSVDYNEPTYGAVNVTLSQLQPGSSFKPFAYVTAFEKGWTGATIVDDAPVSFPDGAASYTPQNYDLKFRGPVTLRYALANSLNIPAIKVLQYASIAATLKTATDLGITTLGPASSYGLALVLGGGDVRPIDMASAYGAFASTGHKVISRVTLKIVNKYNQGIYVAPSSVIGATVLDPRYAYMITSILSDNSARSDDFGPNSPLKLSRPAAAKTGTTNDFRDNWTVGYTPNLVTAVWVGNNDHSAMQGVTGITGAAPIWHSYMEGALSSVPSEDFAIPNGITSVSVTAQGCRPPTGSGISTETFLSTALPAVCR